MSHLWLMLITSLVNWALVAIRTVEGCPMQCTCSAISGNFCPGLKSPLKSDVLIASSTEWSFENGDFEYIPEGTFGNTLITKLSFHNGKLRELPNGVFNKLKGLKDLDLSNNQLSFVRRETFEGLENLQRLNLSGNFMWTYDPDVLKFLPSLRVLDINSSQLACDSGTKGLKRFTEENEVQVPNHVVCRSPPQLQGRPFAQVPTKEFRNYDSFFPVFEMSPSIRQIVFEDDELPLNCSVSVNARDMHLTWKHNNKVVPTATAVAELKSQFATDSEQQTRFHETLVELKGVLTSMLVISQLKHEDTGQWQCTVKSTGEKITELSLDVMVLENSAIFCPKETTENSKGSFTWPKTVAGFSHPQYVRCPHGKSAGYSSMAGVPKATRNCDNSGRWSVVDHSACAFANPISRQLAQLTKEVITKETYLDILRQLVDITANAVSVTNVEDINFVAQIVNNVWRFVNEDDMVFIAVSHTKITDHLLHLVSNLQSINPEILLKAQSAWKSCSQIVKKLQNFATLCSNMADTSFVSSAENAVLKTVRINALDANRNRRSVEPSDGLTCAVIIKRGNWADGHVDDLNSVSFEDSEIRCISPVEDLTEYISDLTSKQQVVIAGLKLDPKLFQVSDSRSVQQNHFFKVHLILLRNASLFPEESKTRRDRDPRFLWFQTGPVLLSSAVLGDMNNLGVQISPLQHPKTEVALLTPEAHSKIDAQIDTWSFAKHTWSDNGCKVEVKFNGLLNLSIAECPNIGIYSVSQPRFGEVNQGVYFWHFVQRMEAPVQIGTGVCVLFCLLIVITFTIFHRQIALSSLSMHIVVNISTSIILLSSLFSWGLFFNLQTPPSLISCKLLGITMHYFTLSTATWMLIYCSDVCRFFEQASSRKSKLNAETFPQIAHDKPPSNNGGQNSNISGSSQNMSVASHRSKSAKNGNFEDLAEEGSHVTRAGKSGAIKCYIFGWGVPAVLCVATALASLAIHGDNQFCWVESKLVIVSLIVPAGAACVISGAILTRLLICAPEDCYMQSAIKHDSSKCGDRQSKYGVSLNQCIAMHERYPNNNSAFNSQQNLNLPNNHSGSSVLYYPTTTTELLHDTNSASVCCKPTSIGMNKTEHDYMLSEAESLVQAVSLHSNQSNGGGGGIVNHGSNDIVHPMQVVPSSTFEPAHLRASMAFKTNNSGITPTKYPVPQNPRSKCHYKLRAAIVLFVSMSLSWCFGALILFYDKQCHWVFSYLYSATTAFTGFFLFLNYIILRSDVKNSYYALFCNRKLVANSARSHAHSTYQMRTYPTHFCSDRKSSQSSVESGYTKSGNYYARRAKSGRSAPTPHTGSYYLENASRNLELQNGGQVSNMGGYPFATNPAMNQVLISHNGRIMAINNPRGNMSHVRSAHAINRTMGTTSRSGSSVREFDLVSLPEHVAVTGTNSNNVQAPHVSHAGHHTMNNTRSQNSINEVMMGSHMSNNGQHSDHESQKSNLTPGGHNTPVSTAQQSGRVTPSSSGPSGCLYKMVAGVDVGSKQRQPLGYASQKSKKDRSTPNLTKRRSFEHQKVPKGSKMSPGQHVSIPVPVAAILPVRQNITPDILKVSSSTGLFSGMSNTSGSKVGMDSEDNDSYSSSDDDESTCSFPGKQQFHKLIPSNSRSTVLSSDKADSCV